MKKNNKIKKTPIRTVLLMRHGKSEWEDESIPDFERALAPRGRSDSPVMGRFLRKAGKIPDLIISSPAKRAKSTAELVAKACGYKKDIVFEESVYENSCGEIINVLQELDDTINTVLIIGHNPSIEDTVKKLIFREIRNSENGIKVPTAAIACLETEAKFWSELYPGDCTISWFVTPRLVSQVGAN